MINIGIIGAGRIGRVHGESISKFVPNAKVKAIADPFLNDNTIAWANALGITETYTDYKKYWLIKIFKLFSFVLLLICILLFL